MDKNKVWGTIFVTLACFAWGTACLFVMGLMGLGFDNITIAAGRCIVAAACLLVYMPIRHRGFVKISPKQLLTVAVEGISFYTMAALYFYAMQATTTSTASMLISSAPVFVCIVSVIFFKEKMTVQKVIAIVISLIGAALVVGIVNGFKFNLFGVLMGVLGSMCYASYTICTKIAMRSGMATDVNITYSFCFSAVLGLIVPLIVTGPAKLWGQLTAAGWQGALMFVGIGIVTGAFAGLMFTSGVKRMPAGLASSLGVLEPITTAILSVIFLHEKLDIFRIIGIVLVLVAVLMLSVTKTSEAKEETNE